MKQHLEKLPADQRLCFLKFDEMKLKKYEEYSKKYDFIVGLVDFGPLGRQDKVATDALLFGLDSINSEKPWREMIGWVFTRDGFGSDEIVQLLKILLSKLKDAGADVKAVLCD